MVRNGFSHGTKWMVRNGHGTKRLATLLLACYRHTICSKHFLLCNFRSGHALVGWHFIFFFLQYIFL